MPNPASAYCEQQGYRLEIRTASDGSPTGYCIFPDDSECDECAYFRGVERLGITAELEQIADQIVASFEWEK